MVRTDFAQLEKRKASFQSWKGYPQAFEMALAGLYYIGMLTVRGKLFINVYLLPCLHLDLKEWQSNTC